MPGASIRVGSIMGIPIYLHFSFLAILPFLAWSFGNNIKAMAGYAEVPAAQLDFSPYVWGLFIALALFGSVLLHELGHSYVALKKGVKIKGITLMILGGVAQLEEMPSRPGEEAQIALAGPVVSVFVGAVCYLMLPYFGSDVYPNLIFTLSYLGYINIFLAGFNLLPAFPMDGGRILRSLLAKNRPFITATHIAANVGKVFAFGFGIWGLINGNFMLVLIAFFIFMGASQEFQFTVIKSTLDGLRVSDLMTKDIVVVESDMTVDALIQKMMQERHTGYPVMRDDNLVGCVTMEDLMTVGPDQRVNVRVSEVMSTNLLTVEANDDVYLALNKMSESDVGRLPVMENERLVGIISRSDIMRGFSLKQLQT